MNIKRYIINVLVLATFISILSGCSTKRDSAVATELANIKLELARAELAQAELAQAERADTPTLADNTELADIKDIAEEGFIFGLPIVMNYAVMNEFTIDKSSGQHKATFNRIFNDTQVFTY
ncbi:hypothetical protein BMR05_09480 [Methylococcaceae bacterium HT4]|nr:hypothetical protein BMR05_09480 [Methylococcaceae bacterium HT4]